MSDAARSGRMSKSYTQSSARERITQVVEGWFLTEPLLFAAWTMHDVVEHAGIETLRVGNGEIQFNADFVGSLRRDQLQNVLAFEATRILLGHPYNRRQPDAELAYQASNLTVQECLRTPLPIPRPSDLFGDDSFNDQYFEFYYRELSERKQQPEDPDPPDESDNSDASATPNESEDEPGNESENEPGNETEQNETEQSDSAAAPDNSDASSQSEPARQTEPLPKYADAAEVGSENTSLWENDDLTRDEIQAAVREAAENEGWGTLGGSAKEQLLATLRPRLDYRAVLRQFRQSVLSVRRRLTRMKPSRRYGFGQMGSRYDFTTRLLFAVDVSGSMGNRDLRLGFSVVSRFFQYGIESVDVIWFDEAIRGGPLTLRRARSEFEVIGRGGTNFQPVLDYIDAHRDYDGLIVFTDGYAAVPPQPKNRRTQVLWLFKDEATYQQMRGPLRDIGKAAFLKAAPIR